MTNPAVTPVDLGNAPSLGRLPGTLEQAFLLSRYQLRDYLRARRFVLMMAIVGALGAILTFVLYHYHGAGLTGSGNAFYGSLWVGGVRIVIIFAGIIFGGDAIAGEFQNRTGYFLMGLPVRRASVYVGKFLAAFVASLVAVLVYLAILLLNGVAYLGPNAFPAALGASFAIAVLYLLALLGSVFFFSSLFKNSLYAVLVVAVLFLFGFSLLDALVSNLVQITPWFIITYAEPILGYPFLGSLPAAEQSTFTGTTYYPTYLQGLAVFAGYFLATAVAGLAVFEREEFT